MINIGEIKSLVCKVRTVTNEKFISNYVSNIEYYFRECGIERKKLMNRGQWHKMQGSPSSRVSFGLFLFLILHIGAGGLSVGLWYLYDGVIADFTVENMAAFLRVVGGAWVFLIVVAWWRMEDFRLAPVTVVVVFVVVKIYKEMGMFGDFGDFELGVKPVIMFAVVMLSERFLITGRYGKKHLDDFKFSGDYNHNIERRIFGVVPRSFGVVSRSLCKKIKKLFVG